MTLSSNCKNNFLSVITKCVSGPFPKLYTLFCGNKAGKHPFMAAIFKSCLLFMKLQATLLQTMSLALLVSSCNNGTQQQQVPVQQNTAPDTAQKKTPLVDSMALRDSLKQRITHRSCPACGMG